MNFNDLKNNLNTLNREARIDELEKVRTKIIKKANSGQWSEPTIYGMQKAVFIIDNELSDLKSELKGEQKVEKVDCDKTDCSNCINRNYCDYEYTNRKENKQ